ncbi:MAG: choice-of-anchor D domain-containing protein [Candidatus Acidiferrales bacterium]
MIVLAATIAILGLSSCTAYTNAKTTSKTPGSGMLSANLATVSFGTVGVGKTTTQSVTVTNTGTSTVTIDLTAVSGASFTTGAGTSSATIAPGQSKTIQIQFAPLSPGSSSGGFTIVSDASNSPLSVALVGIGGEPGLAISPASFNFGSVQVGSTGSATITLINSGTESVSINQASVAGTGFSAIGLAAGATIAAGQSTTFTAQFAPTTSGSASGSISVASNAPNSPLTVALSGSGSQAQISAIPSTAGFGNVSTGTSNSQTISLTNNGTASLVISHATVTGTGFSITGLSTPLTIPTGSNTTFNAVFAPGAAGAVTGSISLTSNAPNSPLTIALSGSGLAGTQLLTFSTSSLSFGSINVGSDADLSSSLTNTGNSSVTISAVNVTGAVFTVSGISSGETLAPGQSVPVTVQFAPTAAGAVSGAVTLLSNATNSAAISLSGSGAQQSTHTVGLAWTDSTTTVAGYNVYRGTSTGGPYVSKLTAAPVTSTQFTDSGLQSGQTYYYVVTAVDSNGVESVYSNQATALIP